MVRISTYNKSPSEEGAVQAIPVYYVYRLLLFTHSLCIFSLFEKHTQMYLLNKQ